MTFAAGGTSLENKIKIQERKPRFRRKGIRSIWQERERIYVLISFHDLLHLGICNLQGRN